MRQTSYGQECIVDVHDCKVVFSRQVIKRFCMDLCELLGMQREDLVFWDYQGQPEEYENAPAHLKGTSAVQFIRTSNITIHALDELKRVYLNVFSCKPFDTGEVCRFVERWTEGTIVNFIEVTRI